MIFQKTFLRKNILNIFIRDNILAIHYIQPEERQNLLQIVTNSEKCF
jgi:hypothetical protein